MGESFKKHEHNSLIVTYQQGTSQKVRGQANSLPGPLLRRTKKKKRELSFLFGAEKKIFSLHIAKKLRPVTRSLARGSEVENKSKVKGSMPVETLKF